MELGYFLELVDLKHRYGANLKFYHAEWKKLPTSENFFYWLDYGEGENVDLPGCTRATLDEEQVRYLSREERLNYLVHVDEAGKFIWARNNKKVDTSEKWHDSKHGIVPKEDQLPDVSSVEFQEQDLLRESEEQDREKEGEEAERRYPDPPDLKNSKGPRKLFYITPATVMNHLIRSSVQQNTWIFVSNWQSLLYHSMHIRIGYLGRFNV